MPRSGSLPAGSTHYRRRRPVIALPHSPWFAPLLAAALSAAALVAAGAPPRPFAAGPPDRPIVARPAGCPRRRARDLGGVSPGRVAVSRHRSPVGRSGSSAWAAVTAVSVADDWIGVRPPVRLAVHALAALAVASALLRTDAAEGFSLPLVLAVAGHRVRHRVVRQSVQLHGRQRRARGGDGDLRVRRFRRGPHCAREFRADACFALVAATSVFLVVNLPPARTFMGDGGSVGLGFLAAVFGFSGIRAGTWPAWFPLLVFLPFVADATVTVLRRLARGDHLVRSTPDALLSTVAPDGARAPRHLAVLRRSDRRHVDLGIVHAGGRAGRGLVGACRVGRRDRRSFCRH